MSLLEEFVAEINRGIFFREFSFTKNDFTPTTGQNREFADHVIWIDDQLMLFQIKERTQPHTDEASAARWFQSKVINKGTRQIRDTLAYLQEFPAITIENQRGHQFDVAEAGVRNLVKIVLYHGGPDFPDAYHPLRHHVSRTGGFIHVIDSAAYFLISRILLTPAEILDYFNFREKLLTRFGKPDSLPSETALLGQYLCEALDAQPKEEYSEYVERMKQDPSDFDLSGFLGALGDHLIDGEEYAPGEVSYYPILAEFAKLFRGDLAELKKRFLRAGQAADTGQQILPFRIVSHRTDCGFIIIPITPPLFDLRLDWLRALTKASKYECRVLKQVGVAVSRLGSDHLVEWSYAEGPWRFNRALEDLLRDSYPFRPLQSEGRDRYNFD